MNRTGRTVSVKNGGGVISNTAGRPEEYRRHVHSERDESGRLNGASATMAAFSAHGSNIAAKQTNSVYRKVDAIQKW